MTSLTFYGGVNEIGGNKILLQDKDTKVFLDFGMSFGKRGDYFDSFMSPRTATGLRDFIETGLVPDLDRVYRSDLSEMMGKRETDTDIDAVLLTHAHVDHCAYIPYLREDIPIYCSEESKLIMQNFDDTGSDQYITHKEKFQFYKNKKGEVSRASGENVAYPRKIEVFQSNKEFSIDSIKVEPLPVDHSISGVHAFILHTSDGSIGNTADLRFHGRRKDDTEKFVERCGESDLDILLCEGTRVEKTSSLTEYDVETKVADIVNNTKGLAICGYPIRDLDRLMSFFIAAKNTNRYLVIDMKQAYLLKLFTESESLKGKYPSPIDKNIKIYIQRGTWGLIDKNKEKFSDKQLYADYPTWQRPFLDYPNAVDYRDIQKKQNEYIFFCSDFRLQDLIDIKPDEGATYIRSLTEPFDFEMEHKVDQVKNWFVHFGVLKKDQDWHQIHVSGHGDGEQIKKVIDGSNSKKLIPIHTQHDEYHKKWHSNVQSVNQHGSVTL